MCKYIKNQQGQSIVLFALLLPVIFGFIGMVIDLGYVFHNKQLIQDAVDAAALAGAQRIAASPEQVISDSVYIADKNGVNANELTVNFPYNGNNNAIEVVADRTINYFFLPVLGFSNTTISARSVAEVVYNSSGSYTLFSKSLNDLQVNNTITVNGNIFANGNILLKSSGIIVNGVVEAAGYIDVQEGIENQGLFPNLPYQEMPYIDIEEYRNIATQYYTGDIVIDSKVTLGDNEIIFVDGSITIKAHVEGTGKIIATGTIAFIGSGINFGTQEDTISFFAGNHISFSGSSSIFSGIFYTYDGIVDMNAGTSTFYGRIYADTIMLNSSGSTFIPMDDGISQGTVTWNVRLIE